MAARYQHVTDPIRRDVANRIEAIAVPGRLDSRFRLRRTETLVDGLLEEFALRPKLMTSAMVTRTEP
jgi:hypothetical protein